MFEIHGNFDFRKWFWDNILLVPIPHLIVAGEAVRLVALISACEPGLVVASLFDFDQ
jgi:hypothetical protein